jgi:outer membrane lipoprotein-sorting protein
LQLVLNSLRQRQSAPLLPLAALLVGLLPLTGCLSHTRSVRKTRRADVVLSADLDQLLKQVDERYAAIHSATAFVQIVASTGGSLQGQVKDSLTFSGYIILGKPEDIRVILKVPLLGSQAFDMVSDGKKFMILIPPKSCALTGSDEVTNPAQKGIYSLRPSFIFDSMMIRGLERGQIVSRTQDIRVIENPRKKNDLIEEPDYDIEFLSQPEKLTARTLRVLHISRADLKPYRQDIYDAEGHVVTQAFYSDYQAFGDIDYPTKIVIQRPLDELGLTITINKGTTFNQTLDSDEFKLDIPSGIAVHNMDGVGSGAVNQAAVTNPCAAHETQSPR